MKAKQTYFLCLKHPGSECVRKLSKNRDGAGEAASSLNIAKTGHKNSWSFSHGLITGHILYDQLSGEE